jgi:hypothetical protein
VAETPQISKWKCWHARAILRPERMNPIKGEQLLTQLNWRYAAKQFDPTRKISAEDWATLENALIRTAGDKDATQKKCAFHAKM